MQTPLEEALFHSAIAIPPSDRAAFLDRECAGDSALRARLEALLAAHDHPDTLEGIRAGNRSLTIALNFPQELSADGAVGMIVGRYKLLERLGEGGWGVVFVAEQSEPVRRRVALKLIKPGMDSKAVIARFSAERQALAMMDHPNIAKVLDAGTTESGRPYFVMELVRGIRITEYCDREKLSVRDRLDLFIKVCHAIQHAHQKGIIHRDIKPSNILVTLHDGVPVPKVIDFGIAKATEGRLTEATVYTQFHQFIGTPAYMSPEQAEMSGLDVDTRSDIYSLGVLLYELLTGVTPFDAKELMQQGLDVLRRTIREKEPVRPSTRLTQLQATRNGPIPSLRRSALPSDLDWIVMKCLEKDRARRYQTANGLAADLKRHLANEPVTARPPSAAYRFQKAWRRNRLAFSAGAAVAVALLAGICVSGWQAQLALIAERKARLAEQEERRQAEAARSARDRATKAEAGALASLREAHRSAYVAEMSVAFAALADNNLGRVRELLSRQRPEQGSEDLRGFEWRYLWQLAQGDELATFDDQVAFTADFSPDGKYFAYGNSVVVVRANDTQTKVATLETDVLTLRFAPRSSWLVTAHDRVTIWDTERWQSVRTLPEAGYTARFSPDERWLATGIQGGYRVWETTTWEPVGDCAGAPINRWHGRHALVFSPDSQFLLTIAGDRYPLGDHLRVWRVPTLEESEPVQVADGEIGAVAFSPDGTKLITGLFDGRVIAWDFATRRPLFTRREHTAWIPVVMTANNGRTFLTASADRTLIIWDWETGEPRARLRGHTGELWSAAYSPDGRRAISGSNDGTTKLWATEPAPKDRFLAGPNLIAGFANRGREVMGVSTNSFVIWNPLSGSRAETHLPAIQAPVLTGHWGRPYAVKPDELVAVRGCADGTVEAWDLRTGTRQAQWPAHEQRVGAMALSPDGQRLATGSISGEVKVWDFATQQELTRFEALGGQVLCVVFSPDGTSLAASSDGDAVWVWSLQTQQGIRLGGNPGPVFSVAFSPDGTRLANTTMAANEVRLWELPSGRPLAPLRGHVEGVCSLAFSPDGKTIATGCTDRRVTLWNVETRHEIARIRSGSLIPMVDFSPDGTWLTIGDLAGGGRQIRALRAPSFAEIELAEKLQAAKRQQH